MNDWADRVDRVINDPHRIEKRRELKPDIAVPRLRSNMQIWVGTKEGLGDALAEAYKERWVDAVDSTMEVIADGVVQTGAISKWCGIEKPPTDSFNLRAPDGFDGSARWIEYESGWSAPEIEIYALRIEP